MRIDAPHARLHQRFTDELRLRRRDTDLFEAGDRPLGQTLTRYSMHGGVGKLCGLKAVSWLSSGIGDDALALLAEPLDAERDDVPDLEELRGLHAEAHAGWGAGGDDVAGKERHELADVGNEVRAVEDHRARVAALALLAVHVEPHVERLRVGDLVGGDQPRPDGTEGVASLALVPLAAAPELEVALRDVVHDAITGDMIDRPGFGDALRLGAD